MFTCLHSKKLIHIEAESDRYPNCEIGYFADSAEEVLLLIKTEGSEMTRW